MTSDFKQNNTNKNYYMMSSSKDTDESDFMRYSIIL